MKHAPFCLALLVLAGTRAVAAVTAIPTFHSLGLYWSDSGGSKDTICEVRFRKAGTTDWRVGYPLWFDSRHLGAGTDAERPANEYRGSLVNLDPGTRYELELTLRGADRRVAFTASTWSDKFPIAKTVELPEHSDHSLVITESGTPTGYILFTPAPGKTATIDIADRHPYGVQIYGAYVIVRGVTIKNAWRDGVRLEDTHDVIIEDCDISGWGRLDADAGVLGPTSELWGMNGDAGIYSRSKTLTRVIIQRNRIHSPRTDTNNWSERRELHKTFHPRGPQGIYLIDTAGHLVIRYNEFGTDNNHRFNDIVAGDANFSWRGFPNRDSDIYGNKLHHCWDDGIEAEGGNCNVRIWGNYLSHCYTGIATAATSIGPIYIFRNVFDISARSDAPNDSVEHGPFAKLGDNHPRYGGGRRYFFHNTLLQQPPPAGSTRPQGAGGALSGSTSERPMVDVVSRNNVWHLHRADRTAYSSGHPATRDNDIDFDLTNGASPRLFGTTNRIGSHMIAGAPEYAWANGAESGDGGKYMLTSTSPGYDAGELLPNFSDGFTGVAPDVGAHEASTAPLEFGVKAYRTGVPMASPTGVAPIRRTTYIYKTVDRLEIKADVHRLDDRESRPVLVWIHGGALMGGGRERFSSHVHRLINDGVIVVSIDYRLAPETKLPAIIEDLEDAFKWLHTRGPELFQADVKRVGVWGHSAGGYLTLTAGFRVKPTPQVLVSAYGYGDLIGDWYSTPSPHAGHRRIVMSEAEARAQVTGAPIANNRDRRGNGCAFYELCRQKGLWPEAVSGWDPRREAEKFHPYMAVKNITPQYPPTFLMHGTEDTDVPYEQSVMMAAELKRHGVTHEFITLQNGEHDFSGADPALVRKAYEDALVFVKRHLGVR